MDLPADVHIDQGRRGEAVVSRLSAVKAAAAKSAVSPALARDPAASRRVTEVT
jgi:hypothetical protein